MSPVPVPVLLLVGWFYLVVVTVAVHAIFRNRSLRAAQRWLRSLAAALLVPLALLLALLLR